MKWKGCLENFIYACLICAMGWGCKKEKAVLNLPDAHDYYPMQTGHVFIYRMDSTVIPAFGTALLVNSYMAKDSIDSEFEDNLGRKSYRIYRYVTDTLRQQPWAYLTTWYVTPTETTVETNEDNMRFIKLISPVTDGAQWKGNSYIDTKSIESEVTYLDNWDYTYQNINAPYTVIKGAIDSTITVLQHDENSPDTEFDPSDSYHERDYSVEVYAKGIGLVYKDFLHWTWQINPTPAYQDGSYGIRLNLVEYH